MHRCTRIFMFSIACATALAGTAEAIDFKISATKKTASQRSGSLQALHHTSTRLIDKNVFYRFDITRVNTQVPERLTVEWIIIKEQIDGKLGYGSYGSIEKTFPFGQEISIESDPVELTERQFSRGGSIEQQIEGYALRIRDGDTILAEESKPSSIKDLNVWARIEEIRNQQKAVDQPVQDQQIIPRRNKPFLRKGKF